MGRASRPTVQPADPSTRRIQPESREVGWTKWGTGLQRRLHHLQASRPTRTSRAHPKAAQPNRKDIGEEGNIGSRKCIAQDEERFLLLVQTEDGDLFKITMEHQDDEIRSLKIKYFDTVPVATGLCILRSGFLFVASEYGPQLLYSFQKLGDDDDLPEYISTDYDENGAGRRRPQLPIFTPRPLDNLVQVDEVPSLDPILDAKPMNPLASDSPQIFAACEGVQGVASRC